MARNKYVCRVCGKKYEYCPSCQLTPDPILENGFCCKDHYGIFTTLSKHGAGLMNAKETVDELGKFILPVELAPSIKSHIDAINEEVKPDKEKRSNKVTHE